MGGTGIIPFLITLFKASISTLGINLQIVSALIPPERILLARPAISTPGTVPYLETIAAARWITYQTY